MCREIPQSVGDAAIPKPEVGACYAHGWRQMKVYVLEAFLATVVALLVSLPGYALLDSGEDLGHGNDLLAVIGLVYLILAARPMKYCAFLVFLGAVRGRRVEVRDMFDGLRNYINIVFANLFVCAIIAVGLVLFIVPGLMLACRLSFTPFLVVEERMEAVEAVKKSWRLTRGHAWTIFLMALVAIPIVALGLACLGVGVIGAMMWVGMAHSSMYHSVTSSAGLAPSGAPVVTLEKSA